MLSAIALPPLVLTYHVVRRVTAIHDPYHISVQPTRLIEHVGRLRRRGYRFATLSAFVAQLRAHGPPAGLCALTFDDGSEDNATVLPGLLAQLDVPATLFVSPGILGAPHHGLHPDARVRIMSERQLREVAALPGVEIGSHTTDHVDLSVLSAQEAEVELAASKAALERMLDRPVPGLAFPSGRYCADTPLAARRAGHEYAATCGPAGSWDPHELRREYIESIDGRLKFALKSRGRFYAVQRAPAVRAASAATRPARRVAQRLSR